MAGEHNSLSPLRRFLSQSVAKIRLQLVTNIHTKAKQKAELKCWVQSLSC